MDTILIACHRDVENPFECDPPPTDDVFWIQLESDPENYWRQAFKTGQRGLSIGEVDPDDASHYVRVCSFDKIRSLVSNVPGGDVCQIPLPMLNHEPSGLYLEKQIRETTVTLQDIGNQQWRVSHMGPQEHRNGRFGFTNYQQAAQFYADRVSE